MSSYFIKLDRKRCIGCNACELHCKLKNKVPMGAKLGQLVKIMPSGKKGKPGLLAMFMPCFHCKQPWCVAACPTGAMAKREDGIVMVHEELCVGCKACISACPWQIPQWDDTTGKAIKCDYCSDRLDEGLEPACVTACCAHALEFISPNKASQEVRETYAKGLLSRSALK